MTRRTQLLLGALHWFIIANFAVEIAYASYMVFFVVAPSEGGPLFSRALELPHEAMVTRRLYAIECWIAIAGLSVYLAVTEVLPRRLGRFPPAAIDQAA
ncbi:hypothetical protein ACFL59_03645 [Planctomycetota bacterium]